MDGIVNENSVIVPLGRLKGENWLHRHIAILPQGANVLELGCGEGYDSAYLLGQGMKVLSTDLQQGHLDKTRQVAGENVKTQILDLLSKENWEKLADNSFDVVMASLCLHYFSPQETERIINEIKRVLKPNGKLLARVNSV